MESSGNPHDDFSVIYTDETLVRLQYNGSVTWKPADTYGISCEADGSKYPFDEQTCNFPIVPCCQESYLVIYLAFG